MTTCPTLTVDSLHVSLGPRAVLNDVSFRLDKPGLVALAGPNGAGKSTLLKAIAGTIRPTRGRIDFDGRDVCALTADERARTIAYLPQERAVHWNLPARTVVGIGRLPHRRQGAAETAADRAAIARALAAVDATALADRPVLSLSGGERARILMARALAQEAPVLLADEPAAGLDPAHHWALFETLARIAATGIRVVVAMHDLGMISRFASDVVLLANGRRVANGAPLEVLTAARLSEVYGITATTVDGLIVPTGIVKC